MKLKNFSFFILLALLSGWMLHAVYTSFTKKPIMKTSPTIQVQEKECSNEKEIIEKIVIKEVLVPKIKIVYKTKVQQEENTSKDMFAIYLKKGEFFNAIEYYQDADEEKHPAYQSTLSGYFAKKQTKNLFETIEQMQYFIELEPQSKVIVFQLARLFVKKEKYEDALDLIVTYSYGASYYERSSIYIQIKSISLEFIIKLSSSENFKLLIDFLQTRQNIGVLSEFYAYELAKAYLELKKYLNAMQILEELSNNNEYKERAIKLLAYVQMKLEELEEYPIQIPLIRHGSHFLVQAYAQNIPLTLMIDTGASITTVDYNLIQSFKVLKENVQFNTAGGKVFESIFQAHTFSLGLVSLNNFKISGSHFSSSNINGLLGMNFLGKFKFKIDQKEAILFLGDKKPFRF